MVSPGPLGNDWNIRVTAPASIGPGRAGPEGPLAAAWLWTLPVGYPLSRQLLLAVRIRSTGRHTCALVTVVTVHFKFQASEW